MDPFPSPKTQSPDLVPYSANAPATHASDPRGSSFDDGQTWVSRIVQTLHPQWESVAEGCLNRKSEEEQWS